MSTVRRWPNRIRVCVTVILPVLVAVAAMQALKPVQPLALFVTPVLNSTGQRLEVLVPVGWRADTEPSSDGGWKRISLKPAAAHSALMNFVKRLVRTREERMAVIWISVRRRVYPDSGRISQVFETKVHNERTFVADAALPVNRDLEVSLQYLRTNEGAFRNTAPQFLESIKVTR